MSSQTPKTTSGWQLQGPGKASGLDALKWIAALPLPELGPTDVLVKFHAASLNYRDIAIINGTYPIGVTDGISPGSDGAGEVIAVGSRVKRFILGDKVITHITPTGYFSGLKLHPEAMSSLVGSGIDGTFREYGVVDEEGLVAMPSTLTYDEGACIAQAYVTAWNCLYGGLKAPRPGDCVLVQGSGGVSLAALQLAVAAGARVIATTSSSRKAEALKKLGASHVINYNEDAEWGATAKKLSPSGIGCTHVIDVVGEPQSFRQSLEAIAQGGEIGVVGFLNRAQTPNQSGPGFYETLLKGCVIRGVMSGSRQFLEEVCHAIEVGGIKPAVDERVFELSDLKEAYKYVADQKHFGKVVVRIP